MLVLSRKLGESIVIGGRIIVTVVGVHGHQIRLGVEAPKDVPVFRKELLDNEEVEWPMRLKVFS